MGPDLIVRESTQLAGPFLISSLPFIPLLSFFHFFDISPSLGAYCPLGYAP